MGQTENFLIRKGKRDRIAKPSTVCPKETVGCCAASLPQRFVRKDRWLPGLCFNLSLSRARSSGKKIGAVNYCQNMPYLKEASSGAFPRFDDSEPSSLQLHHHHQPQPQTCPYFAAARQFLLHLSFLQWVCNIGHFGYLSLMEVVIISIHSRHPTSHPFCCFSLVVETSSV